MQVIPDLCLAPGAGWVAMPPLELLVELCACFLQTEKPAFSLSPSL